MKIFLHKAIAIAGLATVFLSANTVRAQRMMERLDRGLVAQRTNDKTVFLSWRLLGTESKDIAFNLYRAGNGNPAIKLNSKPLTTATCFVDSFAEAGLALSYSVRAVIKGKEATASEIATVAPGAFALPYRSVPLQMIPGYIPNDGSVGDLDGDGNYEIILHQTGRGHDNSHDGLTDPPVFQAYKLDGTLLWTINLGKNIREGAHYTQFMVYDLDGDGKAEIAMKTADGTIDGKGKIIGDSSKDWRNREGRILDGPEFFTVFSGLTGEALATAPYISDRYPTNGWGGRGGNGGNDNRGNRVDRFVACVAYLDGKLPSVIMCRGYYGRTVLAAWDWRGGKLTSRWVFDTKDAANPFSGMGNHNLAVGDIDADGKDEIVYGAMAVDDDGKGMYTTGLRHGDAIHLTDLDPDHPGLEVFGVHEIEEGTKGPGSAFFDAKTGKILWQGDPDNDVGRGMSADIDPRYPGCENWGGAEGLKTCKGEKIGPSPRSVNFRIWWDGDLLSELLDGTRIAKWDYQNATLSNLLDARDYQCVSNNGSKANPVLSADLWGDWREEVIYRSVDNKELRIFTTTIPTQYRFPTLMHDPEYRLSIAWQNVGYNQPPYTGYFLGQGMKEPVHPAIRVARSNP